MPTDGASEGEDVGDMTGEWLGLDVIGLRDGRRVEVDP